MSSSKIRLPPYPVQIGSVKTCVPEKHLQTYIQCGNYAKVKKMLQKGIFPDATNSHGQTPLFVAALLGLGKIVELLLNFGANPNHRCLDWSTPVHAAAFSCDQWIMSKLIDAGGDLRLHDQESRRPSEWALMAGKDESAQMTAFINRCTVHMEALIHFYPLKPIKIVSSQDLIDSTSFTDLFSPRKAHNSLSKPSKFENLSGKKVRSFGYGQFCVRNNGQAGFLLTLPFIEEKFLVREESKPSVSYAAGPYMTMTNMLWGSTEVTVKGLNDTTHNKCFADLLIAEEENISFLRHPLILQLLALATLPSLATEQLVFERVTIGSFYNILHERRSEFPVLHMETLLHILLQMTEALVFLHWRGFIHRSFSSHAIQICSGDRAKLSNLEYMVESKEKTTCDGIIYFPIPKQLYRWSSPEVVAEKTVSVKSDLYSFCTVMQESLTDALPWHGVDDKAVKDSMVLGHYLTADPTLSEPYYSIVSTGIQARPQERTTHLQDIGYLLKNNFKQVLDKVPCTKPAPMVVEAGKDLHGTEQETAPDRFQEITDQFYKSTDITSYHCSSAVSYTESQSETLCDMVEETDEMMAHLPPLENKGQTRPENFYRENVVSPSASSSLLSDCETGTSSDSEEDDIDCSSLETNENWQVELQALDNRLNSIQVHNKPTLGNLQYIQMFLQERNTVLYAEEEQKEPKKFFVEENEFPPDVTFKVKHALPVYSSKSHAKGPPLHYIPPDGSLCSRIDITSATRRRPSEIVEKTKEMALKKVEWCAGLGSPKEKTVKQLYSGQDLWQSAEKSSEQNQADDEVMRHQSYPYSAQERQSKKLAKEIQLSSILKSDSRHLQSKKLCEHVWDSDKEEQAKQEQKSNKDRCEYGEETKLEKVFRHFAGRKYQSPETEDDCEISVGMNPPQASMVKSKGSDDSNVSTETSYFTAETDVSGEKMEQKTLDVCDESDQSLGPCSTMCFDKTLVTWTGERAAQKNIPGHTSIGSWTNTSSTIDVEELSSISCNQKSSLLPFTTPRNTESSARHSTPMSPGKQMLGAISKTRSSQENQRRNPKSFNEKSLASQPSSYNIFSKTSESFLSAMCNSKDYVSLHQEERLPMNDQNASINPIKSGSEDAALPGPQDLSNKTDLQCQSMEITCLISETICSHSKSGQHI